jgi:hypothetical protein
MVQNISIIDKKAYISVIMGIIVASAPQAALGNFTNPQSLGDNSSDSDNSNNIIIPEQGQVTLGFPYYDTNSVQTPPSVDDLESYQMESESSMYMHPIIPERLASSLDTTIYSPSSQLQQSQLEQQPLKQFLQPPIANAGISQIVEEGSMVRLDATNSYDPDGDAIISYMWQQISGIPLQLHAANAPNPTFIAPPVLLASSTSSPFIISPGFPSDQSAVLQFSLIVTDSNGQSSMNPSIVDVFVKSASNNYNGGAILPHQSYEQLPTTIPPEQHQSITVNPAAALQTDLASDYNHQLDKGWPGYDPYSENIQNLEQPQRQEQGQQKQQQESPQAYNYLEQQVQNREHQQQQLLQQKQPSWSSSASSTVSQGPASLAPFRPSSSNSSMLQQEPQTSIDSMGNNTNSNGISHFDTIKENQSQLVLSNKTSLLNGIASPVLRKVTDNENTSGTIPSHFPLPPPPSPDGDQINNEALSTELTASATPECPRLPVNSVKASGYLSSTYSPSRAVDGSLNTRWSNYGLGSWIQVDLGSVKSVCMVGIAWGFGSSYKYNFVVSVSSDGSSFTKIFSGTSSGTTTNILYYDFPNVSARYVRITVNGNNFNSNAHIAEMAALGYSNTRILLPMYMYPTLWQVGNPWEKLSQIAKAHPTVLIHAIINPNSGPGTQRNGDFVNGIKMLKEAGIKVWGYTYTQYGTRSSANVKSDIDKYATFYPGLYGILFDEMSNRAGYETYYAELTKHAKSKGFVLTGGNPGASTLSTYVGKVDTLTIYEGSAIPSSQTLASRTFNGEYHKNRFNYVSYGIQSPLNEAAIKATRTYVGYLYVTNDVAPNPWDTLPSYFEQLVRILES